MTAVPVPSGSSVPLPRAWSPSLDTWEQFGIASPPDPSEDHPDEDWRVRRGPPLGLAHWYPGFWPACGHWVHRTKTDRAPFGARRCRTCQAREHRWGPRAERW